MDANKELRKLRGDLCQNANRFCIECFKKCPFKPNPPNVFRTPQRDEKDPEYFFIFDKPNSNDGFNPNLVPIEIFDQRPPFQANGSMANLWRLMSQLGLLEGKGDQAQLSPRVHLTNAVKCDKSAKTGKSGQVRIGLEQADRCTGRFLLRELAILKPSKLVFFGGNSYAYLRRRMTTTSPKAGKMWHVHDAMIAGVTYRAVFVPHTARQSFNNHGRGGHAYLDDINDKTFWS